MKFKFKFKFKFILILGLGLLLIIYYLYSEKVINFSNDQGVGNIQNTLTSDSEPRLNGRIKNTGTAPETKPEQKEETALVKTGKSEILFGIANIALISDEQLLKAIQKLGKKSGHLFIGVLLAGTTSERERYIAQLKANEPNSLERVEAELAFHRDDLTAHEIENFLNHFPNHLGLQRLQIERLFAGGNIAEAMAKLRHAGNARNPPLAEQVMKATKDIYQAADLSVEAARESAALGLMMFKGKEISAGLQYEIGVLGADADTLANESDPLVQRLVASLDSHGRAELLERYGQLRANDGSTIGLVINISMQNRAFILRNNGIEPSATHPLRIKQRCIERLIKTYPDFEFDDSQIDFYEKVNRIGEVKAMLSTPDLAANLSQECRKILKY